MASRASMLPYLQRIKDFSHTLSPQAMKAIEACFQKKSYKKGAHLLKPSWICSGHHMIQKGILRKYFIEGEREITTEIYLPGDVAIALDSYLSQLPSQVYLEAVTDAELTTVDKRSFDTARKNFPELNQLDRLFAEYYAVWFERRLRETQTLSASDRYRELLECEPHLLQLLPLTIIASFLNVSPETLSRIRSAI
ncbi:Crp/Fnr family transcriptional regulator [bacterium SCSIO 12741]|nr:Crp/Fnr family transcriptional regulator [bacterium SCSIO 12741]